METGPGDSHSIDFTEHPLQSNQIFLIRPGQVHTMKLKEQKGFLFAINRDYFERLCLHIESYADYSFPDILTLPGSEAPAVRRIADLIYAEHEGLHRKSLLNSYMHAFITHLLQLHTDTPGNQDIRVNRVLSLIDTHFISERTTDFYAREVNLSNKRMNELTKKAVGHTVKQLIDQRLLLEAKQLDKPWRFEFQRNSVRSRIQRSILFHPFFQGTKRIHARAIPVAAKERPVMNGP